MKLFSTHEEVMDDNRKLIELMTDARISSFGYDSLNMGDEQEFFDDDGNFDNKGWKVKVSEYMESAVRDFKYFAKSSGYGTDHIELARCINIKNEHKLNKERLGVCWTTPEYFDEYARNNLSRDNLYCILGYTTSDNIDWETSAECFGEFYENSEEYELRVVDDTKVHLTDIKKVVDWELVDLTQEDYNAIIQ